MPADLDRVVRQLPATVFGTGCTARDYIHVDDIARAVIASPGAGVPPTLNVGTVLWPSPLALAQLRDQTSIPGSAVGDLSARGFDMESAVLNVGASRALTGHDPIELSAGLPTASGWVMEHAGLGLLVAYSGDS